MSKGKTQRYYDSHPAAAKRKKKKDAEINRRPEQKKRRAQLNRENRKRGNYGNGDGKDLSHTKKGLVYKPQSVNRGSRSDSAGDRRARGGGGQRSL